MSRISRYLLAECLGPFLLGMLIYTVLFLVQLVFQMAELAIRNQISLLLIGKFLVLSLPRLLTLTVPMSVLLGILVGVGRMSADSEMTALRACGVSYQRMLPPLVGIGLMGMVVSGVCGILVVPEANYAQHRLNAEILLSGDLNRTIQPRVFFQEIPGLLLYADETHPGGGLQDVLLVQQPPDGPQQLTLAEWVRIDQDRRGGRLRFRLHDGETHEFDPAHPEQYSRTRFQDQVLVRPPDQALLDFAQTLRGDLPRNVRELRTLDLLRQLRSEPSGTGDRDREARARAQIELHRRLAIPPAALIFALLGLPLGVVTRRGGRSAGFAISLGIILVYWLMITSGENLARSAVLPVWLGLWLPNLVFGALAIGLLAWLARDRRLPRLLRRLPRPRLPRRVLRPRSLAGQPVAAPASRWALPDRIDRYLAGQYLRLFLLILVAFYVFYFLLDLRTLLDEITENHVNVSLVLRYFANASPSMVVNGLPLAALLSTLLAIGMLERHNEITALKAAGVSVYRLSLPILIAGSLATFAHFALGDSILPQSNARAAALRAQIREVQPVSTFGVRRWMFGQDHRLYNLASYRSIEHEFQGVSIYQIDPDRLTMVERIEARTARYEDGVWVLRNGWIRRFDRDGETFDRFDERRVRLPETPAEFQREVRAPAEMTSRQLEDHIDALQRAGYNVRELRVALYEKGSMAAVPLVLVLLGLTFAFRSGERRAGNLAGIGLAVMVVIVYYVTLASFRALGEVGLLPPLLAAWSPGFLFGGIGAWRMLSLPT